MRYISFVLVTLSLGWTAVLATAAFAQQQMPCAPHDEVMKVLTEKYHEVPIGIGMSTAGNMAAELTVSAEGTWSLLVTRQDGCSALIAGGNNWNVSAEPPKPGRPS